ncbi:MAG: AIR synthase related protein [Rhodopseudomonas palustris]|nr:AIR synthase related protein [Rhodopseudomonas palustris]
MLASAGCGSSTTTLIDGQHRAAARAATPRWCACDGRPKALALTVDVTPRYCEADPVEGGKQAVAEAWRNVTAVGARAAGDHRQSQFRQSGAAGDHGPARRLRRRASREACIALDFADRLGQRLALQRNQRPRRSCRRPRSAASACSTISPNRRRWRSRPLAKRYC